MSTWGFNNELKKQSQTSQNPPVLDAGLLKTVEDQWKLLLGQSDCLVKNSCREPFYGESKVNKIRSCKTFGGPVLVFLSSKAPKVFEMFAVNIGLDNGLVTVEPQAICSSVLTHWLLGDFNEMLYK